MNKAFELFTAIPKLHNCAQAVAAGAGNNKLAQDMSSCGGGKAPLGRCGALHAALCLTKPEKHSELIAEFVKAAGFETCREIKGSAKPFPCAECVRVAAELAEKYR